MPSMKRLPFGFNREWSRETKITSGVSLLRTDPFSYNGAMMKWRFERMGAAARKRVVENFTWDHFRARLLDAYELAMQKGH